MKYQVLQTARFKRELKRTAKRGCDLGLLKAVVALLAEGQPIPEKHRDHALAGKFSGFRECHITPDWLLVCLIDNGQLVLTLTRTGSHSDLFG
jgi:mRNA interferase YafQ